MSARCCGKNCTANLFVVMPQRMNEILLKSRELRHGQSPRRADDTLVCCSPPWTVPFFPPSKVRAPSSPPRVAASLSTRRPGRPDCMEARARRFPHGPRRSSGSSTTMTTAEPMTTPTTASATRREPRQRRRRAHRRRALRRARGEGGASEPLVRKHKRKVVFDPRKAAAATREALHKSHVDAVFVDFYGSG